jgi:hypothetical protein
MLALPAGHMVATAVLLDCRIALGTLLGVGRDPVCSLGIISALLEPPLYQVARSRLMVCENASEAKAVPTVASHRRHHLVQITLLDLAFNSVYAVWSRAPFQCVLVLDIGPCKQLVISAVQIRCHEEVH